jgi:ribonucleotide reductase alpha subunit
LIKDLIDLGIWNKQMKDLIILNNGSVQDIENIPQNIKELYKTVWEIKQKHVIDMSADRAIYICQTQSLNIYMEDPDFQKLSSMHFYGHQKGLKTGSYYLRTRPKVKTQQFTIDPELVKKRRQCIEQNGDTCVLCSS